MEGPSGEEDRLLFSHPSAHHCDPVLRATAGFKQGCLQKCGCHRPGPRLIWAQALDPSNWSLLFTPFPREQGHSGPWLKGSNFKHWVKKKVRSWLPPRCMHFRKMTLSAEARKEKMISLYSSLSPSFHKLQQVPICQECPAGRKQ